MRLGEVVEGTRGEPPALLADAKPGAELHAADDFIVSSHLVVTGAWEWLRQATSCGLTPATGRSRWSRVEQHPTLSRDDVFIALSPGCSGWVRLVQPLRSRTHMRQTCGRRGARMAMAPITHGHTHLMRAPSCDEVVALLGLFAWGLASHANKHDGHLDPA